MKNIKYILILLTAVMLAINLGIFLGRYNSDGSVTALVDRRSDSSGLIDLNKAKVSQLSMLPGISEAMSRRIIEYRDEHGPFESIYDLLEIPGISYKTMDEIKDYITVE